MWHNHFATSNLKVDDHAAHEAFPESTSSASRPCRPLANFADGHRSTTRRLLQFLDAPSNRKEHPNENLGR